MSPRSLARRVAYRTGWLGAMHRLRHRRALTVVTFHRVLATGDPRWATADPRYTVDADLFRSCLRFFRRHYSPVSLEQVERGRLPARPLLVTLDDGWADSADTAAPLLREARVPAVLFVASDTLRRAHAFWPERLIAAQRLGRLDPAALTRAGATSELASVRALIARLTVLSPAEREPLVEALAGPGEPRPWATAEQLRALGACGVAIGAHSAHHEPLVRADDLEHELREPPATLAAVLGGPAPATLSFPHGAYDQRVLERAHAAGYRLLFTSDGSLNGLPAGNLVHRVGVSADAVTGPGGGLAPDRLARCLFPCPVSRPGPRRGVQARAAAAVAALLAAAGLAACANSTPSPSPAPPPPPPTRFVSPAGSDRGSCRSASPCHSFDRAYQVARPGEHVAVAAGRYPLQRIAPRLEPQGGERVTFAPAAGARVRVRELVVDATRVSFADLRTGSWTAGPTARHVTFRDVEVRGGIFVTGARGVRVLGGSVGPGTNYSPEIKAARPGGEPPRDVVIDGVRFHDWVRDNQEAHVDCLHVLAADGLVIRRSSFRNCEAFAVLLTGYGAAASPTNVLVERNDIICCRSGYAGISLGSGHGEAWRDITVRDNRSTESYTVGEGTTAPGAGVRFERNSGPAPNPTLCALPGVLWADNTWSSGAPCGPGDRVVP